MFTAIKEWDDPSTNISERSLKFLNKPEFVKFMSCDYQFRKAVMEQILKPVLQSCLPAVGVGADTVSALLKCMVPNYNMYKLHNKVEGKWIVRCPSGARNCPYCRQLDDVHCTMIPNALHTVKFTLPGNL
eukprot:6849813-Ditylum_brightwellii.AAC.1